MPADPTAPAPHDPPLRSRSCPHAAEPLVTCLLRFPDGGRHTWRFHAGAPLQQLFDFVDSRGAAGLDPGTYRLVTQYPRRMFDPPCRSTSSSSAGGGSAGAGAAGVGGGGAGAGAAGVTLQEAGLCGPREVLFLEPLPAAGAGSEPMTE